jgi:undecaprenyl pyrophosphate phosphatase UppP
MKGSDTGGSRGGWDDRQLRRFDLMKAVYDGKRLATFRRRLGAALILVGAPVAIFGQAESPAIQHVLTILALIWCALVLPMVRLLCAEWYNTRRIEELERVVRTDG